MAEIKAIKTGNWSDPTTWDTGTLPTSADTVRPNGFTVTIDQDIHVAKLSNLAGGTAVAGGSFFIDQSRTIDCPVIEGINTVLLDYRPIDANQVLTINGDIVLPDQIGSSSTFPCILEVRGNGTVQLTGEIRMAVPGAYRYYNGGIKLVSGTPTLIVVGDVFRLGGTQHSNAFMAIEQRAPGATIQITGNVGPSNNGNNNATPIQIYAACNCQITGTLTGNLGPSVMLYNHSGTVLTITGDLVSGNAPAVGHYLASGCTIDWVGNATLGAHAAIGYWNNVPLSIPDVLWSGSSTLVGSKSVQAVEGRFLALRDGATTQQQLKTSDFLVDRTMYTADVLPGMPAASDVRKDTTYGPQGELAGTLVVPPREAVSYGTPVDNTTGVALLTLADIQAALSASGGPWLVTITVQDDQNPPQPITGASVRLVKGQEQFRGLTDSDGKWQVSLDDGVYSVTITAPTFQFSTETLTVADADVSVTYSMVSQTVPPPSSPMAIVAQALVVDQAGNAMSDVPVYVELEEVEDSVWAIDLEPSYTSDAQGVVQFEVLPGALYRFRAGGRGRWLRHRIPDDATNGYTLPPLVGRL